MRQSGIELIGDVSWGTHFCQFYHTPQDLIDVLVPYFQAGLRHNEFCMWVTSEPLCVEEAKAALRMALPELDDCLRRGQIEILDYREWYTAGGKFDSDRVLRGWVEKQQQAIDRGFDGLRLTGNTFWLEARDWRDFTDYEATVNSVIGQYRMIALCTYSLDRCGPLELIDVVSNHQFALIKQAGQWRIIRSEQQRRVEAEQERLASFPELNPNPIVEVDLAGRLQYANPAARQLFPDLEIAGSQHPWLAGLGAALQQFGEGRTNIAHCDATVGRATYDQSLLFIPGADLVRIYALDITERKRAEVALLKAHDALGLEIHERTADLAKAVEALEKEARRRQSAQALAEERSRLLEAFFRHSLNPLVFLDREFNFLRVNDAYARACGREAAEFPGRNHFELYPDAENEEIFGEVVRTKRPHWAIAKPFDFPDHPEWGTSYWDWTLTPILDAAGEVESLVFSLQDVTERQHAERRDDYTRALLELFVTKSSRKEYLDAVLEVIRGWSDCRCLGIRVVDRHGNVPYESYLGFSPEFWQQENWLSLDEDICACTRIIRGAPEPQDAAVMTPGGSFRCDNALVFVRGLSPAEQSRYRGTCIRSGFATLAVIPIRYRGEAIGAIHLADQREGILPPASAEFIESIAPLIGEAMHRFNVEEELRGASLYARGLLEASLDPLVTISPEGKVTDVNRATELATGVGRAELVGSDFSRYFTEPERAAAGYREVLSQGLVRDYPLTIRHASGKTTDVHYNAVVYRDEAGLVQGVFAAARDITDRKRAEAQLKALNDTLERRARQLQHLASELTLAEQRERRRLAQVLHDHLQQLLYAARLNLTTLRRGTQDEGLLPAIQQVDDLLSQCIDESRSLTMEISPPVLFDAGLAAGLEWLARRMEQNYGLAVAVDADPQAEPETEDVRILLFQSVRELLFNVVKHGEVPRARVKMTRSGRQIRIVVADGGAGFDPARIHTDEACAAGFGLLSIRERLELMGGRLDLSAAPGKGTRVTLYAPHHRSLETPEEQTMARPTKAAAGPAAGSRRRPARDGRIRVLLADDHAIVRRSLMAVLEQEPDIAVVAEAADGRMAVEAALKVRPDVVLMDVTMPQLDGIEATRRIAAALPGVRIIGLSGHEEAEMGSALRDAGAVGYVSKGRDFAALVAAVRGAAPPPA